VAAVGVIVAAEGPGDRWGKTAAGLWEREVLGVVGGCVWAAHSAAIGRVERFCVGGALA